MTYLLLPLFAFRVLCCSYTPHTTYDSRALLLSFTSDTTYDSPGASGVLVGAFLAYLAATISVTQWRKKMRQKMAAADNASSAIAVDSMIAFETVKVRI